MPEAVPAPTPVADAAKPTTQAAPETPPVQAPPAADKPDPRLEELAKATKLQAQTAARLAAEKKALAAEKAEVERKAKEFSDWEALRRDRLRNPGKYLSKDYGDNWYERLTKVQLEGTPPADMVASAMDEKMEALQKQLEEREAKLNERFEELDVREAKRAQEEYEASVLADVKRSADKYPLIKHFGEEASVLREIKSHFEATMKQGPDGEWLPGEVLTAQQAAERIEKRIDDIRQKFASLNTPATTPAPQPAAQRNETPQRRNLSTSVTASSTSTPTRKGDDRERTKRALAAWDAALASRQ